MKYCTVAANISGNLESDMVPQKPDTGTVSKKESFRAYSIIQQAALIYLHLQIKYLVVLDVVGAATTDLSS